MIFFLPEVKSGEKKPELKDMETNNNVMTIPKLDDIKSVVESPPISKPQKNIISDFFDPSHIKDAFTVLVKKRDNNKRRILIYVILCNTLFFATIGEAELFILFTRTALNWTTEFSIFVMYFTATSLIGTGISTIFFVKVLKISDPALGVISTLGTIIANPVIVSF